VRILNGICLWFCGAQEEEKGKKKDAKKKDKKEKKKDEKKGKKGKGKKDVREKLHFVNLIFSINIHTDSLFLVSCFSNLL